MNVFVILVEYEVNTYKHTLIHSVKLSEEDAQMSVKQLNAKRKNTESLVYWCETHVAE